MRRRRDWRALLSRTQPAASSAAMLTLLSNAAYRPYQEARFISDIKHISFEYFRGAELYVGRPLYYRHFRAPRNTEERCNFYRPASMSRDTMSHKSTTPPFTPNSMPRAFTTGSPHAAANLFISCQSSLVATDNDV